MTAGETPETPTLSRVPAYHSWKIAARWLQEGLSQIVTVTHETALTLRFASTLVPTAPAGSFGRIGNAEWRRAVLATFLADLASYPSPADQVTLDRLAFVMSGFPFGFRTYWAELAGTWWPVGYAAWYPMLASAFATFADAPSALRDRMVVPAPTTAGGRPALYLFNYSVASSFRGTALSSALVKRLAGDIATQRPGGLAAITVSDDGSRVARRFGMTRTGSLVLDGCEEHVYAARLA